MGTACEDRLQEDLRKLFLICNVLTTGEKKYFLASVKNNFVKGKWDSILLLLKNHKFIFK